MKASSEPSANGNVRLQILISTMGTDGIRRIAATAHPAVEGVEYIVSWQKPDPNAIPEALASRPDFRIFPTGSRGLGANRQDALSHATAPYILISDDDLDYDAADLRRIIRAFDANPEYAYLLFRYDDPEAPRSYPDHEFDMSHAPKNYYYTSFEIGINRRRILLEGNGGKELRFNPRFGVGAEFCAGEENIMVADLQRAGHHGKFIPIRVATHRGPTTGMRRAHEPEFLRCKGAAMAYMFPRTWPLRMLTHALRERHTVGFFRYCSLWLAGIRQLRHPGPDKNPY